MQKISRVHVANYGAQNAWYDGLTFELTDPETGGPCDVVLNLENGGGKTTLLGFIFSCFDTRQERFLKHLQDRNHRFSEYFAKDGAPGFLVMEWSMPPKFAGGEPYRLVLGQAVSVRSAAERDELERQFFAFEATTKLEFASVPAAGLAMEPAQSMAEFLKWMHSAERTASDFFHTRVQEDWQKHLAARSIDVEMLRLQVEFSAQEGGIDASFLTFHNEADFLRKFFGLTLDAEKCAAVRQVVVGACDTLRLKPALERRLSELTRFSGSMKPFVGAATGYEVAREEQAALETSAVGLRAALLAKAVSDEAAMGAHAQEAEGQERTSASSAKRAKESEARAQTLRLLQFQRAFDDTEAAQTKAEREVTNCEHELRLIHGTKALVTLEEARGRLTELQSFEEAEREGLKPARMQAEIQGALLRFSLQDEQGRLQELLKSIGAREATARSSLGELKYALHQLSERVGRLNRAQGTLQRDEERFSESHARLRQDGLFLDESEGSEAAVGRIEERLTEARSAVAQAGNDESRFLATERSLRTSAEAARLEADGHARDQAQLATFVAKGEAERERLSQLSVLRAAIEAEVADPDSPALMSALERLRSSDEAAIAAASVRLAELESNRKAIEATGVAGRSRDVDEVVGKLLAEGIRSARPYNTYLADAIDDAGRSRALVLSDPARFLGVAVASAEFSKARAVLTSSSFRLARPVVVSESALESLAKHGEAVVLGPEDDATYSRKAARLYAERLDKALNDARSELEAYRHRAEEAVTAREQLRAYIESYGRAKLDQARANIDRLAHEAAAAVERASQASHAADEAARNAVEAKARAADHSRVCAGLENDLRRLREFQNEHEAPRSGRLARQKEIEGELLACEKERGELATKSEETEKAEKVAYEERVQTEAVATRVREEWEAIALYDAKYPAQQALATRPQTLAALRRLHADAKTALETAERDRLGVLAEKLRTARETADAAAKEFAEKYAALDVSDLVQRKGLNFDAAVAEREKTLTGAKAAERGAREKHTSAKTALEIFRKQNARITPPTTEMEILKESELARHIERSDREAEKAREESEAAKVAAADARSKQVRAQESARQMSSLAKTLTAALSIPDHVEAAAPIALEADASGQVNALIEEASVQRAMLDEARRNAQRAFNSMTRAASAPGFQAAEPELSALLAGNEFEAACADRVRLAEGLAERISTTEESIARMREDFEACVVELHVLSSNGVQNLSSATTGKRVPDAAPYVGGKPVLKMRANFSQLPTDVRRDALRRYLDTLIDTGIVPAKGADLVAECVLRMHGKPLGLQVLKMVPDEEQQYVSVDQLKNSGGEGVTMAMFLYLVINQLRAETHAKLKKAGGGPLILDNPFAKATTPTLWRAQRLLAEAMDVQLIFATALPDYNTLGEFRRFIRLRKVGKNQKTGRWHLEHANLALAESAEQYA